jgi:Cu(I)/Ag(I) efflux system membrane protein CusA/SilA
VIAWCVRNWLLTLLAAAAIAVAGLWAWTRVPVDAIPDLSDNQVIVWAEWPGKSPEDVDEQVTRRIARGLQGLPGIRTVRGLSLPGTGYVYAIFADGRDLYECRTRTLERLAQIQADLPAGVAPRLGPDATAMGQVFAFALRGPADPERKRWVLDQIVAPALQAVPGVAEVAPAGGVRREYQIDVDPRRLAAQGIALDDLEMAVARAGRDIGAMSIERSGVESMLRGRGFIRSAADVERIVLRGDPARGAGVRLGDVAAVRLGGAVRQGLIADETGEQVGAIVAMRVHEDPRTVIAAVKDRLHDLAPALAREQLTVEPFYDRSQLILETNATLARVLIEEITVTALVIVAFLLHARASIAVAAALPLGVLLTFLAMHALGVGANIMSLAGIGIAIGVMVDFGIVVAENIAQHLARLDPRQARTPWDPAVVEAVIDGTREVSRALLTAAATTVISFLPLFLLDDQAGRLFTPLAATKTLAIAGAVLFGMLLVPVLCRLLLPPWQARRPLALACAGLAAGAMCAWLLPDGLALPRDHGRWTMLVPGWIAGPLAGALAGFVVWRLMRERLVAAEENPVSRGVAVGYDWALTRMLDHKRSFTAAILLFALTGWLLGLGWASLSWPLRQAVAWTGGDLTATTVDRALVRAFPGVGASFLPPLDEGSLLFMPSIPAAGGLGESQRVMEAQNRLIADIPEVAGVMGKLGRAETALDPAPIGMVETVVVLKPYRDWPVQEISLPDGSTERRPRTLAEVRAALAAAADIPGVAPSWLQPIETRVVMLSTGIRSLIALQVQGDDADALERFAERAEGLIRQVPGARDVQMQREGGKPYAEFRLDSERLARAGLDADRVLAAIETGLGGMAVAWSVEGTSRYAVRIRYQRELRDDPDELGLLLVPLPDERGAVPLIGLLAAPTVHTLAFHGLAPEAWRRSQPLAVARNLTILGPDRAELTVAAGDPLPEGIAAAGADAPVRTVASRPSADGLTWTIGPMAIRSEGGKRIQYVLLNVEGRGEVEVVRDAEARLRAAVAEGRLDLPAGATWRWVGRFEQKLKADATMRWVIALSMAAMLVLILIGTRSWLVTAIIIGANLTVTTAGGMLLVWWFDAEMTTAVVVGFLVLLGVMFNDGILLGTYLHDLFRTPPGSIEEVRQRVYLAGLRRRRPAIMTNCTTLLSLIPILWSDGRGAELMRPMVLPVIGGMVADYLSLFSVPVFYAWWWERRLARRDPPPVAPPA